MFTGLAENSEEMQDHPCAKVGGGSRMANSRTPRGTLERCRPMIGAVFLIMPRAGLPSKTGGRWIQHKNSDRGPLSQQGAPLSTENCLAPQPELLNERAVAGEIFLLEIIEKATPLADDLH